MGWIIVSMVIIAGLFYLLMKKHDHVIEQHEIKSEYTKQKPYALILGETKLADCLKALLESRKIDYLQIKDENHLDKSKTYDLVFAVSNDDLSNMLACIIVNQVMEHCRTIAVCNQLQDRKLFEQNNIPYLLAQESNADTLFQLITLT